MEKEQNNRPSKVSIATKLLYISLVVGLISALLLISLMMYFFWSDGKLGSIVAVVITFSFFTILLNWLYFSLIRKIRIGRNWARITFFVIVALYIPACASGIFYWIITNTTAAMGYIYKITSISLGLFHLIIYIIALVFLCTKESISWFRERKATL